MAIKREVKETGIYVTEKITATGEDIGPAFREDVEAQNRAVDIDHIIEVARADAQQLIDLHDAGDWPGPKIPDDIRQAAIEDARSVLIKIRCWESNCEDPPNYKNAMAFAFHIGKRHERLLVRIGAERFVRLQRAIKAREEKDKKTKTRYRQALKMLNGFCERDGVDPETRKGITIAKINTVDALRLPPRKRAVNYRFLSDELKKIPRDKNASISLLNRAEKSGVTLAE